MDGQTNVPPKPEVKVAADAPAAPPAPAQAPAAEVKPTGIIGSLVPTGGPPAVPEKVVQAVTAAQETVRTFFDNVKLGVLLSFLIAVVLLFLVLGLVIYWWINRSINQRRAYRIAESQAPLLGTHVSQLAADSVPNPKNGRRMTVSFWIYIYDINKFEGQYRHVWHRGDESDGWESGSPAVYLDKDTNKLHFTLGSEKTDPYDGLAKNYTNSDLQEQKYKYVRAVRGVTVDYIPLQRWVHVAFVVNEEINGGTITAFVDGEIVRVATDQVTQTVFGDKQVRLNIRTANMAKKGNVYVGGSVSDEIGPGFSGLVSRIAFFNYDLNVKDVFAEFKRGPVNATFSTLGAPAYGVRNPIYRLG